MTITMKAPLEIGISVLDVERAAAFYEKAFGFARISEATLPVERARLAGFGEISFRMVRMQTSYGERIKLLQPTPAPATQPTATGVLDRAGISYLTFIVADLDEALRRVVAAGAHPMSDGPVQSRPGTRLAFFRDCEGNMLELCQYDDLAAYRPDLKLT